MAFLNLGEARADFKNWMDTDYFEAAVVAGGAIFASEMLSTMTVNMANATGTKATAIRALTLLGTSAGFYWVGKKYNKTDLGLVASIMPVALLFADLISGVFKKTPQEAGASLAARLGIWRGVAHASVKPAPVVMPQVTVAPVQPAPQEEYPSGIVVKA